MQTLKNLFVKKKHQINGTPNKKIKLSHEFIE